MDFFVKSCKIRCDYVDYTGMYVCAPVVFSVHNQNKKRCQLFVIEELDRWSYGNANIYSYYVTISNAEYLSYVYV